MARKPPTTPPWRPERFRGLPGFAEASDWHVPPVPPLTIVDTDIHRDGGTGYMIIKDGSGRRYPFCFDKALGRLCTGHHTSDDDAAYVTVGSNLEAAVFTAMETALRQPAEPHTRRNLDLLRQFFHRAQPHSGRPPNRT